MLGAIVVSMRPRQRVKNLFVFAGLIFAERLFTAAAWTALAAFAIFCGLSGAIYLANDVADRERCRRPCPRAVRDLSVSLPVVSAAPRRQPVGALAQRPRAADQDDLLDLRGSTDHLRRAPGVNYR
jgi:hypothetical protein